MLCSNLRKLPITLICVAAGLLPGARSALAATMSESDFINTVNAAVTNLTNGLQPTKPIVMSANLLFLNGKAASNAPIDTVLNYVDGLKAAGAQRVDLNPGITTLSDPNALAVYDAVIRRVRQLGMQLAINPAYVPHELGPGISFQDFQNAAAQSYAFMAGRYHPDNFVLLHEPTTLSATLGLTTNLDQCHNFVVAMAPIVKAASPTTRVGAGGFQNGVLPALSQLEDAFWRAAVTIPALDFMTMDIYNYDTFTTYNEWIQLAKQNGKGIYIEEAWSPHYLPDPLPSSLLSPNGNLTNSLDSVSLVGVASPDFASMTQNWLRGMAIWASANDMEALTAFTSAIFFAFGSGEQSHLTSPAFTTASVDNINHGQLTSVGQAFRALSDQMAVKRAVSLSSASYATLPSVFNPNCGTAANPCNPNSTVAPDSLITAFGLDLGTTSVLDGKFPITLGGTAMTIVDSTNSSRSVPLYYVGTGQVNYYVPAGVAPGPATITVQSADGTKTSGVVLVEGAAPGIYTANANGSGAAAAYAVTAHSDKSQSTAPAYTCSSGSGCVAQPLSPGASSDVVVLELFGTGLRHATGVTAQINGQNAPVLYVGPQGSYTGLDQVNVQIPRGLAGSGMVNLVISAEDPDTKIVSNSNTVQLNLK